MNKISGNFDTVVIGGGLAGLVSANFLARNGKNILLIEKGKRLGGRASTTHIHQSALNLGPHALYKGGEGFKVLSELGVHPKGNPPIVKGSLFLDNQSSPFPSNIISIFKINYLNCQEKLELMKVFSIILKMKYEQAPGVSFVDWLQEKKVSKKVALLIQTLLAISSYCGDSNQISTAFAIRQLQLAMKGVLYVDGGWETLVDALEKEAVTNGVTIFKGVRVRKVEGSFPAFKLELASGKIINSQTVISTVSPQHLQTIVEGFDFLNELQPVQGVAYDLILTKDQSSDSISFGFEANQQIYYSNHSSAAKLSEEYEVVHVFGYGTEYDQEKMEAFIDKIQPTWRDRKVFSRFLPNMVVTQGLPIQKTALIAEKACKTMKGFIPAGDWFIKEGLLADASISSGKRAALEIDELLRSEGKVESRRII